MNELGINGILNGLRATEEQHRKQIHGNERNELSSTKIVSYF